MQDKPLTFVDLAVGELFMVRHSLAIYEKTGRHSCQAYRGASGELCDPPYVYENTYDHTEVTRGCDDLRILCGYVRQRAGVAV